MTPAQTKWLEMPHELTPEQEKYLFLLIEAGQAENELKLLVRYQKVVRKIYKDAQKAALELPEVRALVEALETVESVMASHDRVYGCVGSALSTWREFVGTNGKG